MLGNFDVQLAIGYQGNGIDILSRGDAARR